jgi:hypothetical protein
MKINHLISGREQFFLTTFGDDTPGILLIFLQLSHRDSLFRS